MYNAQDYRVLYITLFARLYVTIVISPTCGKHLHDRIISLRGGRGGWSYKTNLTLPLCIKVPVPSQESEQSCICVLGLSILPLSTIRIFDFWSCSDSVVFLCFSFYYIKNIL